MNKKYKKILIIVAAFLILTITTVASYAYFTASVAGNTNANETVIQTGNMALLLTDGEKISLGDAIPGSSVTKTFKVKNTGTISTNYDVYLSEIINTFEDKNDLVYTLTSTNGCASVVESVVPSITGEQSKIVSSCSINANQEHEYSLTIIFKEDNTNQDDNKGKEFSAKISVNNYKERIIRDMYVGYGSADSFRIGDVITNYNDLFDSFVEASQYSLNNSYCASSYRDLLSSKEELDTCNRDLVNYNRITGICSNEYLSNNNSNKCYNEYLEYYRGEYESDKERCSDEDIEVETECLNSLGSFEQYLTNTGASAQSYCKDSYDINDFVDYCYHYYYDDLEPYDYDDMASSCQSKNEAYNSYLEENSECLNEVSFDFGLKLHLDGDEVKEAHEVFKYNDNFYELKVFGNSSDYLEVYNYNLGVIESLGWSCESYDSGHSVGCTKDDSPLIFSMEDDGWLSIKMNNGVYVYVASSGDSFYVNHDS